MASRLTFNSVSAGAAGLAARLRGGEIPEPTAALARVTVKRAPGGLLKAEGTGRTFRAIASTNAVDRHGDVIEQTGWDLTAYKANPIICWNHNYESLPVGRATYVGVERGQLVVEFKLADTRWASQVRDLIDQGVLNSVSVGFLPQQWEPLGSGWGVRHIRQELLEICLVNIPANAEALLQAPLVPRAYRADQPRLAARAAELQRLAAR